MSDILNYHELDGLDIWAKVIWSGFLGDVSVRRYIDVWSTCNSHYDFIKVFNLFEKMKMLLDMRKNQDVVPLD